MNRNFNESIKSRRSYYNINNTSPISDSAIEEILKTAILNVPSAFNSQSTKLVILLGDNHKKVWDITKQTLKKIVSPDSFAATETKIDNCFAAGYGTVLFFEDTEVVEGLQKSFPSYSDNFPKWSQHTSAMHQFAIWTMLENAGFGASLQHYNPLIDEEVINTWNLNPKWALVAQMPFGTPTQEPGEKNFNPIEERLFVYK